MKVVQVIRMRIGAIPPLWWVLSVSLIHGLLFVFLIPPWMHYDEPAHFEKAHYSTFHGYTPDADQVDPILRTEIVQSVATLRQFHDLIDPFVPELSGFWIYQPHPPLYYEFLGRGLRYVVDYPIEFRLYSARSVSLGFLLLTMLAAWRCCQVLWPQNAQMIMLTGVSIACIPPFVDIMSAVNNDVLLNFSATVVFLGCSLLIRDGPRRSHLVLTCLALIVALWAKRVGVSLIGVVAISGALAVWRDTRAWRVVIGVAGAGLLGVVILWPLLNWLDSAYLRVQIPALSESIQRKGGDIVFYANLALWFFRTYWGSIGWGETQLNPVWIWGHGSFALLSSIGLINWFWRYRHHTEASIERRTLTMLLIGVAIAWVAIYLRVHPILPSGDISYFPRGRYLFLVTLPTMILLMRGLSALIPLRFQYILWIFPVFLVVTSFQLITAMLSASV